MPVQVDSLLFSLELQLSKVKSLLQKLLALQGPVLLQMAQLWGVLSRLGRRGSRQGLREIPYMDAWWSVWRACDARRTSGPSVFGHETRTWRPICIRSRCVCVTTRH